jgi:hypothetical protein
MTSGRTEIGRSHNRGTNTDVFGGKSGKHVIAAHLIGFDSTKNVREGVDKAEDHLGQRCSLLLNESKSLDSARLACMKTCEISM